MRYDVKIVHVRQLLRHVVHVTSLRNAFIAFAAFRCVLMEVFDERHVVMETPCDVTTVFYTRRLTILRSRINQFICLERWWCLRFAFTFEIQVYLLT